MKVYERSPDAAFLKPTQRGIKLDITQTRGLIDNIDCLIDATKQVSSEKKEMEVSLTSHIKNHLWVL